MRKNKKNYMWVLWSLAGIIVLGIGIFIAMLFYVAGHEDNLKSYHRSVENLPEVRRVIESSRFVGVEEYFVAKVERIDDEEFFYFIRDEVVAHQFPVDEFISSDLAYSIALNLIDSGSLIHFHVGMYYDEPIYEFKFQTNQGFEYIMINALTSDVIFHFVVD